MCSTVDKQGSVYEHRGIVCIEEGVCGKDCTSVVAQDIYPYGGSVCRPLVRWVFLKFV